jgi:hypothetical protein
MITLATGIQIEMERGLRIQKEIKDGLPMELGG